MHRSWVCFIILLSTIAFRSGQNIKHNIPINQPIPAQRNFLISVINNREASLASTEEIHNHPQISKNTSIYTNNPPDTLSVQPFFQGELYSPGEEMTFDFEITNDGTGEDTYDFLLITDWQASMFHADGITVLTDTDGDSVIDSGPISEGDSETFVVKITSPGDAVIGDSNETRITISPSNSPASSKTILIQGAIPAPFAQLFSDWHDNAMSVYLVTPDSHESHRASLVGEDGEYLAFTKGRNRNLVISWSKRTMIPGGSILELTYSVLNEDGDLILSPTKLSDYSGVSIDHYDLSPSIAVLPNGNIGILWKKQINNNSEDIFNGNLFFVIVDVSGSIVYGPENLTQNSQFGYLGATNYPFYADPHVVATSDNRFFLVWRKLIITDSASNQYTIEHTIKDNTGGTIKEISQLSSAACSPNLTTIDGNNVLMTFVKGSDIYYTILNSAGIHIKPETNLVNDGTSIYDSSPDATWLGDGRIFIAWPGSTGIRYAVLNSSYNIKVHPKTLINSALITHDDYVSVAPSEGKLAVITWMDMNNRGHLYYALVDSTGIMRTPPTVFKMSQKESLPYIHTSSNGMGNAMNVLFLDTPLDHWAYSYIEGIYTHGLTVGYPDMTYKPENPVTRAEMAVFLLNGMGVSIPATNGSHPFTDITGHWAETYIEELFDQGITGGYPDGSYQPERLVTRAEMAVFLLKAMGIAPPALDGSHPFSDINLHWAEIFIEELFDQGITGGYPDGTYRPENQVTRAEMAAYLVNTFGISLP